MLRVPEDGDTPLCPRLNGIFPKRKKLNLLVISQATRVQSFTVELFETIYQDSTKCRSLLASFREQDFSLPTKYSIAQLTLIRLRKWQQWANMAS